MGLHGSDTAAISLDDVLAADDAMLGEVGEGFKVAMSALDSGRFASPRGASASARARSRSRSRYAKEREQFGRPIASFQLVQAMIAEMRVKTDAARMLVWRAGWLKDAGKPNTTETSIAKLYATEAAQCGAPTRRSRCTAARATSTTTPSSATSATCASRRCTRARRRSRS